jgi:hypothetical protein
MNLSHVLHTILNISNGHLKHLLHHVFKSTFFSYTSIIKLINKSMVLVFIHISSSIVENFLQILPPPQPFPCAPIFLFFMDRLKKLWKIWGKITGNQNDIRTRTLTNTSLECYHSPTCLVLNQNQAFRHTD